MRAVIRKFICKIIGHTIVNDRPYGLRCVVCDPRS